MTPINEPDGTPSDQTQLETLRLYNEQNLLVWRAVFEYAQIAIRSIILVNGAAATALLAFLGSDGFGKDSFVSVPTLKCALASFAVGVFCGVTAAAIAYISQVQVIVSAEKNNNKVEIGQGRLRWVSMVLTVFGLFAFIFAIVICSFGNLFEGTICSVAR